MTKRSLALGLAGCLAAALLTAGVALAQPRLEFEFQMGFRLLADQIPGLVGDPLENERHGANGDALQQTTRGLMVWRKADNWTAFTDGSRSWVNGPYGAQERGNNERFKWELPPMPPRDASLDGLAYRSGSLLSQQLLVTWYGNPRTEILGVLGKYKGEELSKGIKRQAEAFAPFTDKKVVPAYHLIAVMALGSPGSDDRWRQREPRESIDSMLEQARAHGFPLILDVQLGHSTVQEELEYLRPYLEQPDVYLALDPEFDMWPDQMAGREIGHTMAAEVNYALRYLEKLVVEKDLPNKALIVHQFTLNMLPDKEKIERSPVVDLALDMDGYGSQPVKLGSYRMVMEQQLQFPAIKLFYDHDTELFTPEQLMELDPVPAAVVYQ
ncbi:MAG: hypothetical protein ACYC5J_08205 [Chloroflexota bacterium]